MMMAVERRWSYPSAVALFQVIISLVQNGTWKKVGSQMLAWMMIAERLKMI